LIEDRPGAQVRGANGRPDRDAGQGMRGLFRFLVVAPLGLIFLVFALANRQNVVVSFDPFNSGDIPSPQIVLPLFIVLIGATMVGVLLGGFATWLRQGRFRKAARDTKAQMDVLRGENESLRAQIKALQSTDGPRNAIAPARGAAA
jgi:uncharacterized integral membrane protein